MQRKILVGMVVGVLFISFASAGLLDYFGMISGEVEVSGPVFYLDGTRDSQYDKYYTLKLNDDSISTTSFLIEGSVKNQWFVSQPLGIDNFYNEAYLIDLRLKTITENKTSSVFAELWIGDEENELKEKICETPIYIGISEEDIYHFNCVPENDKGMKNMDTIDKLILAVRVSPTDVQTKLYTLNSRIEVIAQ